MNKTRQWADRLLQGWALLTAAAALLLLLSGGVVTSKGVGMAVPDWPTTFGYNMFLFPVSQWVGGIFYEHSHRLIASAVGLMTLLLAALAWLLEARRTLKIFSLVLVVAVIVQGVLGGLRVVLVMNHIGILHAMLAQSFFSALCVFCFLSGTSGRVAGGGVEEGGRPLRRAVAWAVALTFLQLALGATMRHEHIGLAVPDFPLAYGKILPDTSPAAMEVINRERAAAGQVPIKPAFIRVHWAHRAMALAVCAAFCWVWLAAQGVGGWARRWASLAAVLVFLQAALGAWTVLSGKSVAVATAHMALGALLLALGVVMLVRLQLARRPDFSVSGKVAPSFVS